eukprot:s8664_g4.t1
MYMRHIRGENAFPHIHAKYDCPFTKHAWGTQSHSAAWKDIAGNAMQLQVLTAVMAYLLSNIVPISQTAQLSFHRGFTSDCDLDDDLELRDTLSAGPEMATVGEVCGNDAKADAHVAGEPVVAEHVASESEKRVSASVNSDTGGSKKKLRLV